MGRLVDIFVGANGSGAAGGAASAEAALEETLAALCARGRAAHPTFGVADETYVAHLARCGAPVGDVLSAIHAEDLYLACAALAGHEPALTCLQAVGRPAIAKYLKRIERSRASFDEVEQRLWDAMLVGASGEPKLATYAGRGPLGSWLGISAQRLALMNLRHERAEHRARNELAAHGQLVALDPEMAAIKERFRAQFQDAVAAALATLDDRQTMLYRMHLVDGLTLERIGKVYGVHHATVLRWLDAARERVIDEAKRRLRDELRVSAEEFDSIARLLVSQLDLNISNVIAKLP